MTHGPVDLKNYWPTQIVTSPNIVTKYAATEVPITLKIKIQQAQCHADLFKALYVLKKLIAKLRKLNAKLNEVLIMVPV